MGERREAQLIDIYRMETSSGEIEDLSIKDTFDPAWEIVNTILKNKQVCRGPTGR